MKNTGSGAAMMRIEAARRIFPRCWFNEKKTEASRDALGYFDERRDENRNVGLGPEHDWSSHAADAFGYLAIAYDEPPVPKGERRGRAAEPPPRGTFLVGVASTLSNICRLENVYIAKGPLGDWRAPP
jgi:hypothetical protein